MAVDIMRFNLPDDERAEVADRLRAIFPRDSYVTTIRLHNSGVTWDIMVLAPTPVSDSTGVQRVSYLVAQLGIGRLNRATQSVRVRGGNMDMAYDIVDSLSRALYGDGRALRHNAL